MLLQQVLLLAGGELLQEREGALLIRGQVGIDYTGGWLGQGGHLLTTLKKWYRSLPPL